VAPEKTADDRYERAGLTAENAERRQTTGRRRPGGQRPVTRPSGRGDERQAHQFSPGDDDRPDPRYGDDGRRVDGDRPPIGVRRLVERFAGGSQASSICSTTLPRGLSQYGFRDPRPHWVALPSSLVTISSSTTSLDSMTPSSCCIPQASFAPFAARQTTGQFPSLP
jgi:hypothetical protein